MNEKELEMKTIRKRNLIKNILIIFLIILLILTFFSNTIMNRSLPNVSTIYLYNGEIKTQIRGTGVVSIPGTFNQQAEETRMVKTVEAVVGDYVEKGQLLYTLTDVTYSETKSLKEAYEQAKLEYELALIDSNMTEADVKKIGDTSTEKVLQVMASYDSKIKALEKQKAEHELKKAENDKIIEDLGGIGAINSAEQKNFNAATYNKSVTVANLQKLNEQKAAEDAKVVLYTDKKTALAALSTLNSTDCQNEIDTKTADIASLKVSLEADPSNQAIIDNIASLESDVANLKVALDINKSLEAAQAEVIKIDKQILEAEISDKNADVYLSNTSIALEQKKYTVSVYEAISNEEQNAINIIDSDIADIINDKNEYKNNNTGANPAVIAYRTYLAAKDAYDKALSAGKGDEIYAKVSGLLTSLPIAAGVKFNPGETIASIDQQTDVKTMTMTVTAEEAARLKVGDPATVVNSWRYENASITLRSITTDRMNSKNKVLTFDIYADVSDGQSLSVNVGNRNTVYDKVVPNSAIREDSDGKYVLLLKVRNTPLGNRYYAEKAEIKVLASDDSNSAISGTFDNWEYVIKTSSAPIKDGSQVKLAEGFYY